MSRVLLDTNIIILHVANQADLQFSLGSFYISTLTIFELLRYDKLSNREEAAIRDIISVSVPLPVTTAIAEQSALLGRRFRRGAIDLLIAATAIVHDLELVTNNIKDFRNIPGLRIYKSA